MGDEELAIAMGSGDSVKGKALLAAMKEVRALDISGDNQICEKEFQRLYVAHSCAQAHNLQAYG